MTFGDPPPGRYRVFLRLARDAVRTIAFWLAITLPFAQLALLASGVDSAGKSGALLVLLCTNGVALVLGHGHTPSLAGRQPGANRNQREEDEPIESVRRPGPGGTGSHVRESDD